MGFLVLSIIFYFQRSYQSRLAGGEGLNLCICMVLLTLERRLGMGGEGLNPDVHAKELLTRLLHVTKSKQRREARSPKLGDPIVH